MPMLTQAQLAQLQALLVSLTSDQVTPKRMTGAKLSPRNVLAASAPYRIRGATPANFIVIPKQLSMWDNDVDGDCVTAEEAFAKAAASVIAGEPEVFIQDAEVIRWAKVHGVLNGADLSSVLDWMAQEGFSQNGTLYNDGPKVSVDWTNPSVLQNAISQGPVKIAVAAAQLQNSVGSSNGWFGIGFKKDTNYDHCVSICGYGTIAYLAQQLGVTVPNGVDGSQPGYAIYTWKTIGIVDVSSMLAITAEAWWRNPTTVIVGPNPIPVNPIPIPVNPPPIVPPPIPNPQPIPNYWKQLLRRIEMLLRMYGPAAIPLIEAYLATMNIPPAVLAIIDQLLNQYTHTNRSLMYSKASFYVPWINILEEAEALISKYGVYAVPLIEKLIEGLNLPDAVKTAIDDMVEAVLGKLAA